MTSERASLGPRARFPRKARATARRLWPVLLLLPAGLLLGFFFVTIGTMLRYSLSPSLGGGLVGPGVTLHNYARFLGSTFYLGYLVRSLRIATYCTLITAAPGYLVAYFMYRSGPLVRLVAGTVLIVQFLTAYVIRTYAVMLVIGRTGILNRALIGLGVTSHPLAILFTETGVAIGLVLVSLPFMVFPIFTSLQSIPANLEIAAQSLGAHGARLFWEVLFPLTVPGLAAGIALVYLFELTSFIVPGILGGGYFDMIANLIYAKAMQSFDYPLAAAMAATMLVVSGLIIYLLQKAFRRLTPFGLRG